jgi:hypothetical protein
VSILLILDSGWLEVGPPTSGVVRSRIVTGRCQRFVTAVSQATAAAQAPALGGELDAPVTRAGDAGSLTGMDGDRG